MNHYEVELEYDIPDWGGIICAHSQHYKTLAKADNPSLAIEEAKEEARDRDATGFVSYSDGEEDLYWRVALARRIPVPDDVLFLDDRVIVGNGWVSDGFIAVPENHATWIPEYTFRGHVDEIDFEDKLFSDLDNGEEIVFSHYGKALYGGKCSVFQTADGQQIALDCHYHSFVMNQLRATAWLRCPMRSRSGYFCIVARDATGHPVAYIMPFVGDNFEVV